MKLGLFLKPSLQSPLLQVSLDLTLTVLGIGARNTYFNFLINSLQNTFRHIVASNFHLIIPFSFLKR